MSASDSLLSRPCEAPRSLTQARLDKMRFNGTSHQICGDLLDLVRMVMHGEVRIEPSRVHDDLILSIEDVGKIKPAPRVAP